MRSRTASIVSSGSSTADSPNPFTENMKTFINAAISEAVLKATDTLNMKIDGLISRIGLLEETIRCKDAHIDKLEADIAVCRRVNQQLKVSHDDLEQYGRRMNVRVENVPYSDGETDGQLRDKLLAIFDKAGAHVSAGDIVRHHRSGRLREKDSRRNGEVPEEDGGGGPQPKYGQCIVKVNTWRARESLHLARKKAREQGNPIKQDLTKRRLDLVMKARNMMDGWETFEPPVYAYANINSDLVMRRGKEVKKFNNDNELTDALEFFGPT